MWHAVRVWASLSGLIRLWESNTISGRPRLELVSAFLIAPLLEEVVFRVVPVRLAVAWRCGQFPVGLVSAVVFGLMHQRFGHGFVAYAGAGGLVLWATYTRSGFLGAVLMHLTANVADLSLGWRRYLYAASSPG
jgi:membrane protease YdiL (CAAX protease family)